MRKINDGKENLIKEIVLNYIHPIPFCLLLSSVCKSSAEPAGDGEPNQVAGCCSDKNNNLPG